MIKLLNVIRCAIDNHTMRTVKKVAFTIFITRLFLHPNQCFWYSFYFRKKQVNHIECAICARLEHLLI